MTGPIGSGFPYLFIASHRLLVDPDVAAAAMTRFVAPAAIKSGPSGGLIDLTMSFGILPNIHLWLAHLHNGAVIYPLTPEDRQLICFPEAGLISIETTRHAAVGGGPDGVNAEAESIVEIRFSPGTKGPGMAIDRLTLIHRLAVLLDKPVQRRLEFDRQFDTTVAHHAAAGEMIRAVLSPALGAALTASPATASALSTTFLDLVLHSLPHNYIEHLLQPPKRIAPRHIKRAMDFVDNHVHSALTVDDLAMACGVSIRSLQYGFRHFLDTSPADHIRNVRLERARRDIVEREETPLSEIAGRWGFANLARFNVRFKSAYGESPAAYRRRRARPY